MQDGPVRWWLYLLATVLLWNVCCARKRQVGLFASTGCYSHDLMMQRIAKSMQESDFEVTWIQLRVFEFNRTLPQRNSTMNSYVLNHASNKSQSFLDWAQSQLFAGSFDYQRIADPLSLRPEKLSSLYTLGWGFANIYSLHVQSCERALRNRHFVRNLNSTKFDLIVVDYILHECAIALARNVRAHSMVYLSNYPIISSYLERSNVPSNPSFVPSVLGGSASVMTIRERILNTMLYVFKYSSRLVFFQLISDVFKRNLPHARVDAMEMEKFDSQSLFMASPFDFLLEVPRPISHRVKYFGCSHCVQEDTEYNITKELGILTSHTGVVLVSFGSISKGDRIPKAVLDTFLRVFGNLSQTVIWQFGSEFPYGDVIVPKNVHILDWIPFRKLLQSREIQLLISHGGITTCLEAAHVGIPVLGIPLQGDQPYNLRRIKDLGSAEIISMSHISEWSLSKQIDKMIVDHDRYKSKAVRLRTMLQKHRSFQEEKTGQNPSQFWLGWAVRNKQKLQQHHFVRFKYHGFWFYYNCDILLVLFCAIVLLICILSNVSSGAGVILRGKLFGTFISSGVKRCADCYQYLAQSCTLWFDFSDKFT